VQFQSFRGSDVSEALSQVRAVLGPDAVIRTTREVRTGSGPFDRGYVEIEAAAGEPRARAARPAASPPNAAAVTRGERDAFALPKAPKASAPQSADVNREIAQLKAAVEALQAACSPRARALGYLQAAGIEGTLATELAAGAPRSPKTGMGAWFRKRLGERLRVVPSLIDRPGRQLIACVGPTGAGKTTTLAKLAARARLDRERSVGVISMDTYRVGAVEQWQRYARLIGVSFQPARDAEALERAIDSLDTDIILVDTEGHVPGGEAPGQKLIGAVNHAYGYEPHVLLVVPAWLRGGDVDRLLRSYAAPRPTAVVATKLDEAARAGGVLHACLPTDTPLAFLCDGPRVPEDVEDASVAAILDRVFPPELLS
jgi:flagellar biosynthesis protein FlhF